MPRYHKQTQLNCANERNHDIHNHLIHCKIVLDQVVDDYDYTVITRRDAQDAVVMSLQQFNGLMETVHLLKSPANAQHLEKSIKQYQQGKVVNHEITKY